MATGTMTWDEYFMAMAQTVALKSKDPSTRVGAVIADSDHRIVSVGFNGPPRSTDDNAITNRNVKLLRTLHAEENAILFAGARGGLRGCTLYCTHHPCAHCGAVIIQSGIKVVVYPTGEAVSAFDMRWNDNIAEARRMFHEAGIEQRMLHL